jgi:flagellar motor switch protein FliN/FliY
VSDEVVYEQFDGADSEGRGAGGRAADLRRLSEVPVELSVEIGRTGMTVGETLDLRRGSIVTLDRLAGEPVDLLVNGTPIARGEVVVVDEQFGLRVSEIIENEPSTDTHGGGAEGIDADGSQAEAGTAQGGTAQGGTAQGGTAQGGTAQGGTTAHGTGEPPALAAEQGGESGAQA